MAGQLVADKAQHGGPGGVGPGQDGDFVFELMDAPVLLPLELDEFPNVVLHRPHVGVKFILAQVFGHVVPGVDLSSMRFWLVELPARIVNGFFAVYAAYLAVLTVIAFSLVLWSLTAAYFGWPAPW
jgi:hypothetical protein